MSDSGATFVDLCLSGRAAPGDIDDYVDAWHDGASPLNLHEFLGMTWEEYGAWVADARALGGILENRRAQSRGRG